MALINDDSRKWWVLAAMGGILGVILLDETVVGVALPTIQRDLSLSEIVSHWVVNIYMLVLAGLAAASPDAARTRWRASRTDSMSARRLRRKTVSDTTDAKVPPSALSTPRIAR